MISVYVIVLCVLSLMIAVIFITNRINFTSASDSSFNKAKSAVNNSKMDLDQHKGCRKVLWFMGVGSASNVVSDQYFSFVIAAINSAKENAPSLIPIVLISGPESDLPLKVRQLKNVRFISHNLTFYDQLVSSGIHMGEFGAYYRLDIPVVFQKILPSLNATEIDTGYALYTDTDVLFYNDINECTINKPKVIAIGPEHKHNTMSNSGVLYLNLTGLLCLFSSSFNIWD